MAEEKDILSRGTFVDPTNPPDSLQRHELSRQAKRRHLYSNGIRGGAAEEILNKLYGPEQETEVMSKRAPLPIESFGPEIMSALIAGATKEIRVKTTYGKAIKFRQRAHQLRNLMREESHPQYTAVARTLIQILYGKDAGFDAVEELQNTKKVRYPKDPNVDAYIVISPQDSQFTTALKNAGVEVKIPSDEELLPPTTSDETPPQAEDVLQNFLNQDVKK